MRFTAIYHEVTTTSLLAVTKLTQKKKLKEMTEKEKLRYQREEFDLKEELARARCDYMSLTDPKEKKAAMVRIADLDMRYNLARDARRKFFR